MKTLHHKNIEILQASQLNWKRISAAIRRKYTISQEDAREITDVLEKIISTEKLGFWSINRKNLINMAGSMIPSKSSGTKIISPICLDPSELTKKPSGINPLVLQHIDFLEKMRKVLEIDTVTFLFPCHGRNMSSGEREAALEKCHSTMSGIKGGIYQAMPMHEFFQDCERSEGEILSKLDTIPSISAGLVEQIGVERREIYSRQHVPIDQRDHLTRIGIAEFLNFGIMAAEKKTLVCIHTTGRSRILRVAGAGILHNPISL